MGWKRIEWSEGTLRGYEGELKDLSGRSRFLADESVDMEAVEALKNHGINVATVRDLDMSGQPDSQVFQAARRSDRILLTADADFLDDRDFPPELNPGIVVLPSGAANSDCLVDALAQVVYQLSKHREMWEGVKVILSGDGRMELRARNLSTGAVARRKLWFKDKGAPFEWIEELS